MENEGSVKSAIFHKSVLVQEVLHYINVKPGAVYLDATFGTGGHTRAILEKESTCKVVALDWDAKVLEDYGKPLEEEFGDRLRLIWGNFALLYKIVKTEKITPFDGILADFGTSQIQILERPGFSVYRDTPLDMRMSPSYQQLTAADLIAQASEKKLADIFWQLGEERYARKIARVIVNEREHRPIKTTGQLASLVEKVIPRKKQGKIHPATRVFQALRIFINKELENIKGFLETAIRQLKPCGRLVCISFHSLEDRIVKNFFHEKAVGRQLQILTPQVVTASEKEILQNPSARSAKLRAAEYIQHKEEKFAIV